MNDATPPSRSSLWQTVGYLFGSFKRFELKLANAMRKPLSGFGYWLVRAVFAAGKLGVLAALVCFWEYTIGLILTIVLLFALIFLSSRVTNQEGGITEPQQGIGARFLDGYGNWLKEELEREEEKKRQRKSIQIYQDRTMHGVEWGDSYIPGQPDSSEHPETDPARAKNAWEDDDKYE